MDRSIALTRTSCHASAARDRLASNTRVLGEKFYSHVHYLAEGLPEAAYVINLCTNRYEFTVAFAAAMQKGQITLLPPDQAHGTLDDLARRYKDSYYLVDRMLPIPVGYEQHQFSLPSPESLTLAEEPVNADQQLAAVFFTSGSQGGAKAIPRYWGELHKGAVLTAKRFQLSDETDDTIIATVPPQHMFGFETSVMLPLVCGLGVHPDRPFYPEDVRQTLLSTEGDAILVTTPFHLRAMVESGLNWPHCKFVLSATAPLSVELAIKAEQSFSGPVLEIYGSTETGAIASRRTANADDWQPYQGVSLLPHDLGCVVYADHIGDPVEIQDHIATGQNGSFRLLGRSSDQVKIAGKRASLADLNRKLLQVPGVIDGLYVELPAKGNSCQRLGALVVAPAVSREQLTTALSHYVDAVFLPRPLRFVQSLPRNATGKLPREMILALLEVK